ncbi:hypothetical protein [Halomarina oriensis]|uniref:Uncharacterized protein n=1 Tax=Halomarina oriensis TaxID=671145 RepID=A0A6B0GJQ6_9EURY|nr:hypothetical protein [Halomarina oriensis]MWG35156.1 hypothetical protein [Halomarina oriensis]
MSELPCVSCDTDIPAEASNCPHCGQRQLTRTTAITYVAVALPVVFCSVGLALVLGVPGVVDATVGATGLVACLLVTYCLTGLALGHAYAKRQRRIDAAAPTPATPADENAQ